MPEERPSVYPGDVPRATWTDERLDDLAESMRTGFARVDQDIRELRGLILRGGLALLGTMAVGFLGVIATIVARGA